MSRLAAATRAIQVGFRAVVSTLRWLEWTGWRLRKRVLRGFDPCPERHGHVARRKDAEILTSEGAGGRCSTCSTTSIQPRYVLVKGTPRRWHCLAAARLALRVLRPGSAAASCQTQPPSTM